MKRTLIMMLLLITTNLLQAQTIVTVGAGGNYSTLGAAINDVNNGLLTNAVEIQLLNSIVEPNNITINKSGTGLAFYSSIKVYPVDTNIEISRVYTSNDNTFISINGNNIIFDGRINGVGSPNNLTINLPANFNNTMFSYSNAASNNKIQYCNIKAVAANQYGIIHYYTNALGGTQGINNTLKGNYFYYDGGSINGIRNYINIYQGNYGDTIVDNHFINPFYQKSSTSSLAPSTISVAGNSYGHIIKNNHFYATSKLNVQSNYITMKWIDISSSNSENRYGYDFNLVEGNYFGGGTTHTGAGMMEIEVAAGVYPQDFYIIKTIGNVTIKGNYIRNLSYKNGNMTSNSFYIIENQNIGTSSIYDNVIGGANENDAIVFSAGAGRAATSNFYPIKVNNGTRHIYNNRISNIQLRALNNGRINAKMINAIISGTGNFRPYIYDNHIGGPTVNERISLKNNIDTGTYMFTIIHAETNDSVYIYDNTIENVHDSARNDLSFTKNYHNGLHGIYIGGQSQFEIKNNIIKDLFTTNNNYQYQTPVISGITLFGSNTRKAVITDNEIYNLTANNTNSINNIATGVFIFKTALVSASALEISKMVFERNFISDIKNYSTSTTAQRAGVMIFNNSDALRHFRNNVIAMHPQSQKMTTFGFSNHTQDAYGFKKASNKLKFYNNTIMVNDAISNIQTSALHNMVDVKNNILVNYTTSTFTAPLHTALWLRADSVIISNNILANNMFVKSGSGTALAKDPIANYLSVADWMDDKSTDSLFTVVNPSFVDSTSNVASAYRAQNVSKGMLIADYNLDFENVARVNYTKGAFENSSAMSLNELHIDLQLLSSNEVALTWSVNNEDNIENYQVYVSDDGKHWSIKASLDAIGKLQYSYTDTDMLTAKRYYKVIANKHDGLSLWSHVKWIAPTILDGIVVYPNPATNHIVVKLNNQHNTSVRIIDIYGKTCVYNTSYLSGAPISLANLPSGQYIVQVINGGNTYVSSIIKK